MMGGAGYNRFNPSVPLLQKHDRKTGHGSMSLAIGDVDLLH